MEGQDQNDELFPIAVLIDELKVWIPGEAKGKSHKLTRL
jgi:hypothetical protein